MLIINFALVNLIKKSINTYRTTIALQLMDYCLYSRKKTLTAHQKIFNHPCI